MNKNKKLGFTLAEVLIVIGIIGVVAALTLPNLNHATGDKEKVTKVKKIYSNLTEAVDRAQAIYGPYDTWFNDLKDPGSNTFSNMASVNERAAKRITEFLKVSKDCGFEDGCFSKAPLLLYGEAFDDDNFILNNSCYKVMLFDGTSVAFDGLSKIRVDIDGPNKGKNQEYVDIFDFSLHMNEGSCSDPKNQLIPSGCIENWTGDSYWYETAWVIENGNLDYLKTDDEGICPDGEPLNWETKTSCN